MQKDFESIPLSYLVYQAQRALHFNMNADFQAKGIPIVIEQWPVLFEIFNSNGLTQQELAKITNKDKTTITRLINTLEKNGLVTRKADENDRRKKLICYTPKSKKIKSKIIEVLKSSNQKLEDELDKTDLKIMRKVMFAIMKSLNWEFDFVNTKCKTD